MGIAISRDLGIEIGEDVDLESFLNDPKVLCRNVFSHVKVAELI